METRFSILLVFLLTVLLLLPALASTPQGAALVALVYAGMLVTASFAVEGGWMRNLALALAVPAIGIDVFNLFADERYASVLSTGLDATFLLLVGGAILRHILRREEVTVDLVLGGTCVYLFMGILFAQIFAILEMSVPGAFHDSTGDFASVANDPAHFVRLAYFSLVTLTTLGYGDVIPVHPLVRAIASMEAVIGQLYLAVFIGNLVGLRVAGLKDRATAAGS